MWRFRHILFTISLLLSLYALSMEEEEDKEEVRIAFTEIVSNTAGFYIDEIEQIYKNIGTNPVISIYPDQRVTYLFEIGEIDALGEELGIYQTQNPSAVRIDVPILESVPFRLFVLKSRQKSVRKLKDPFVLATVNCLGCKEFARIHKIKIDAYVTELQAGLKMLQMERADVIISASLLMSRVKESSKFVPFNDLVFTPKIYHFISKKKIHLEKKLKKEILRSKSRGAFDVTKLRYKK